MFRRDKTTHNKLRALERARQRANPPPARPPLHHVLDPAQPTLFTHIAAWIAGADRLVRYVVDPPDPRAEPVTAQARNHSEPHADMDALQRLHADQRRRELEDPHGFEAMTVAQLHIEGRRPMDNARRLALERALNRKIAERGSPRQLTAEEHEAGWRAHGAAEQGDSYAAARSDDGSLTGRRH